ncbi:MAG: ABC transporter ATP-binding protein [Armatimonadetes bacterium]|nr:ABC transporter ATP-binding protein [Armatimonadota bacterium]
MGGVDCNRNRQNEYGATADLGGPAGEEESLCRRREEDIAGLSKGMAAIETYQLTKRYGPILAVDRLDLRVDQGVVFGFLGPNGAGKSTTMKMLLGLVRPTAGRAWIVGHDCQSVKARQAGVVGAMVEEPAFYPHLSGRENLLLLCRLSGTGGDEVDWALEKVGLSDVARRKVGEYSHGMRQRLGIAAALVPRPRVLILDEPASGLDPAGLREVRDLLSGLRGEGLTVLLSSHLLYEVQMTCSHVGLMFGGRMVATGPVGELLGDEKVTVRVEVDQPDVAVNVLAAHGACAEPAQDGALTLKAARSDLPAVVEALVQAGLRVYSVVPHQRSLEELYMEYAQPTPRG